MEIKQKNQQDIQTILEGLDELFRTHQIAKVEAYLLQHIEEAEQEGNISNQITLLNETIGFYRDSCEYEKSIATAQKTMEVLDRAGLKGSIPYATSLQNIANALRAAGALEASMTYYNHVFHLYENQLSSNDMRYASLSNNMSLLYQEMNDYENACICLEKALSIVVQHEAAIMEVATTHTNLAMSLLKLGNVEAAMEHLEQAFYIFEKDEEKDYHYSAGLSAMGEAKYMVNQFTDAVFFYRKAMEELERNVGKNQDYQIIESNYNRAIEALKQQGKGTEFLEYFEQMEKAVVSQIVSGLELCREYYETFGAPMIHDMFPDYESRIAVGLVGAGSECLGFDDEFSRDHDFGPGFCMWLTEEDYAQIGAELQEAYEQLPSVFGGIYRKSTKEAGKRVGVFTISDFYEQIYGYRRVPQTEVEWLSIEEYQLQLAVSGQVFRDDLQEFSKIRLELLEYYPHEVWVRHVAKAATNMAQTGQYNYSRMLKRGDVVTASIIRMKFVEHTIEMIYLLNRIYAPFYKWQYRGLKSMSTLKKVRTLIEKLISIPVSLGENKCMNLEKLEKDIMRNAVRNSGRDIMRNTVSDSMQEDLFIIEEIARAIVEELNKQGLSGGSDTYLASHTTQILQSKSQEKLVEEMVAMEWAAFDKVEHTGGERAECQNNWFIFDIMRSSQFLAWPRELLLSYMNDFIVANQQGWNMVTEKYGRMMISTDPESYAQLEPNFGKLTEKQQQIIEEIVAIQVGWMEIFAAEYPYVANGARSIHTYEDSMYNTSYETYLRGELSTYGDVTLSLYGTFIIELCQRDENLAYRIIHHTARLYGYDNLDDMNESMQL